MTPEQQKQSEPVGIFMTEDQFYRTDRRSKVIWVYDDPPWGAELFTTPQPDRTAKLEEALKVATSMLKSKDLYALLTDIQNGIDSPATCGMANSLIIRLDNTLREVMGGK